eukprot:c38923_g1_i1.p1 GENE.c38923_g1_i1~~c38923_g1_i1.p1  ORF type:complete len:435 (-),score=75.02 c38923_g1_i1:397-1701(-)
MGGSTIPERCMWGLLLLGLAHAWELSEVHDEYRRMVASWLGHEAAAEALEQSELIQTTLEHAVCAWGLGEPLIEVSMRGCPAAGVPPPREFQARIVTLMQNYPRLHHASCIRDLIQNETSYFGQPPIHVKLENAVTPNSEMFHLLIGDPLTTKSVGDLKPGEIGDFLSHIILWRQIVALGLDDMIILEDDAKITLDFVDRLPLVHAELPHNWDIAWFFESPAVRLNKAFNHPPTQMICKEHVLEKNHGIGTNGYIVSRKGAALLLDLALPIDGVPLDVVLHQLLRTKKINAYVSNPPLVYDDYKAVSVIQGRYYSELSDLTRRNFFDHIDLWKLIAESPLNQTSRVNHTATPKGVTNRLNQTNPANPSIVHNATLTHSKPGNRTRVAPRKGPKHAAATTSNNTTTTATQTQTPSQSAAKTPSKRKELVLRAVQS